MSRAADLPGPRGWPIVGNLFQIDPPNFHLQLERWSREFGPFYKLRLGKVLVVVVGDHECVAALLRERPDGFRRTERVREIGMEMGLVPSLFTSEGDDWRRQRRMVMASFDPGHVKRYFPALAVVAGRLAARWRQAADRGSSIDLQADLMRYTVDTIAGLAFGAEVNTLQSNGHVIQQHLDKIFPALHKRMLSPVPVWRWLRTPAVKSLERSVAEVKAAVFGFVEQARQRLAADPGLRQHPRNLLEAMVAAADESGSGIEDINVVGNVFGTLLAGEDTTANTIAWMMYLLSQNPTALARATEEIARVVVGEMTLEQTAQLDYVEACAHETMRLKPVAPMNTLQALRDTTVGDVQIVKGMVVIGLTRRNSVSDEHVPRAAAFEPERWLGGDASAAKRISMPFGAGPRMCPGRYLAMLEIKMALVVLLRNFNIESIDTPDGGPARERMAFTMMPVGLRMKLQVK